MGATRRCKPQQQQRQHTDDEVAATSTEEDSVITVRDLCSGHGFTGMLYAACNPPKLRKGGRFERINVVLVDKTEPPSHKVLRDCLCPRIQADVLMVVATAMRTTATVLLRNNNEGIRFDSTLEEFAGDDSPGEEETSVHFRRPL